MIRIFHSKPHVIGLVASLLIVVGAFLPWGSSMGIPFTGIDDGIRNGLDDGYLVLVFGVLAFLYFLKSKIRFVLPLLFGIATSVIGFLYLYKIWYAKKGADFIFGGMAPVDVGSGLLLVIFGGIALAVVAIINRKSLLKSH